MRKVPTPNNKKKTHLSLIQRALLEDELPIDKAVPLGALLLLLKPPLMPLRAHIGQVPATPLLGCQRAAWGNGVQDGDFKNWGNGGPGV